MSRAVASSSPRASASSGSSAPPSSTCCCALGLFCTAVASTSASRISTAPKAPVASRISFVNERGVQYAIQWVVKFGSDPTRLNPLGSPSLYAKKCYHTITLPDGTANEVGVIQPTGVLRIDRSNNVVKVFINGQAAVVGVMSPMGQLVGFEIDIVKAKNGALFFTDFKIGR